MLCSAVLCCAVLCDKCILPATRPVAFRWCYQYASSAVDLTYVLQSLHHTLKHSFMLVLQWGVFYTPCLMCVMHPHAGLFTGTGSQIAVGVILVIFLPVLFLLVCAWFIWRRLYHASIPQRRAAFILHEDPEIIQVVPVLWHQICCYIHVCVLVKCHHANCLACA